MKLVVIFAILKACLLRPSIADERMCSCISPGDTQAGENGYACKFESDTPNEGSLLPPQFCSNTQVCCSYESVSETEAASGKLCCEKCTDAATCTCRSPATDACRPNNGFVCTDSTSSTFQDHPYCYLPDTDALFCSAEDACVSDSLVGVSETAQLCEPCPTCSCDSSFLTISFPQTISSDNDGYTCSDGSTGSCPSDQVCCAEGTEIKDSDKEQSLCCVGCYCRSPYDFDKDGYFCSDSPFSLDSCSIDVQSGTVCADENAFPKSDLDNTCKEVCHCTDDISSTFYNTDGAIECSGDTKISHCDYGCCGPFADKEVCCAGPCSENATCTCADPCTNNKFLCSEDWKDDWSSTTFCSPGEGDGDKRLHGLFCGEGLKCNNEGYVSLKDRAQLCGTTQLQSCESVTAPLISSSAQVRHRDLDETESSAHAKLSHAPVRYASGTILLVVEANNVEENCTNCRLYISQAPECSQAAIADHPLQGDWEGVNYNISSDKTISFAHVFHHGFAIPEYEGKAIVLENDGGLVALCGIFTSTNGVLPTEAPTTSGAPALHLGTTILGMSTVAAVNFIF